MTSTTNTNALTATQNTVVLGSVTGLADGNLIQMGAEYMKVVGTPNTTTLTAVVKRGQNGSVAEAHGAGEATFFGTVDEFDGQGASYPSGLNGSSRHFDVIPMIRQVPTSQITTASAVTYTAGQLLGGRINRDPNGAGRTDVLPTAALLVAAIPGVQIGSYFEFWVVNQADAAETITISGGTGATAGTNTPSGADTLTIAQNTKKKFGIRFTNVTPGSEAYTFTNEGGVTY